MTKEQAVSMKCKVAVIADDLTGAGDAGIKFREAGLSVVVLLDLSTMRNAFEEYDIVALNTDSRHLRPGEAYEISRRVATTCADSGVPLVYKKIDSTLRGNVGAEIDGMMDALQSRACILAPASPANGRVTLLAHQYVNNVPIDQSEAGADLLAPSRSAHIATIVRSQSPRKVAELHLDDVRHGAEWIRRRALTLVKEGFSIIVTDATEQRDLAAIADAAALFPMPITISGSAGLAAELPRAMRLVGPTYLRSRRKHGQSVLVIVGSATQVSADQVICASQDPSVRPISIGASKLECGSDTEAVCGSHAYLDSVCAEVGDALESGLDVIVSVERSGGVGDSAHLQSRIIKEALSQIAVFSMGKGVVSGVALTGGDTAVGVCESLRATGIELVSEVQPGMPSGRLLGGCAPGMAVVTKAGGFGDPRALKVAIEYLRDLEGTQSVQPTGRRKEECRCNE